MKYVQVEMLIPAWLLALFVAGWMTMTGCEPPETSRPAPRVQVVAFTASWCEPCKRAAPTLTALREQGVSITAIDIDQHPSLAKSYDVSSVPTFLVLVGDSIMRTHDVNEVSRLCRQGGGE